VFLTAAFKSEEFKRKGYEVGAVDYLTKPIDTEKLISKIKGYLHLIDKEREHHLDHNKIEKSAKDNASKVSEQTKKWLKKDFINELEISMNTIISYSKILANDVIDLGVSNNCLPAIKKIITKSQHLLEMLKDQSKSDS
jgi:response regulator RpfG family c-di-GMP phosphodiesterase